MKDQNQPRPLITLIVAVVLALFYIGSSWFLLQRFALDNPLGDISWQRALIIYNGIASVGFAAIGVLLGTSVQQINLNTAHQQVAEAKALADQKSGTIKAALQRLASDAQGKPADLGGAQTAVDSRVADAREILIAGLS